jgi:hypothetical protein
MVVEIDVYHARYGVLIEKVINVTRVELAKAA